MAEQDVLCALLGLKTLGCAETLRQELRKQKT
jgi:hypothetical protein